MAGQIDSRESFFIYLLGSKNDLDEVSVIYSYVLSTRFGNEAATKDE